MGDAVVVAVGDPSLTGGNRFVTVCTGDTCSMTGMAGTTTRPALEGLGDTEDWATDRPGFFGGAGTGAADSVSFDKRSAMWGSNDSMGASTSF